MIVTMLKPTSHRVDRRGTRTASARIESNRPSIADRRAMLSAVAGVHSGSGLTREIEQQRRVGRRPGAKSQHFVVTRAFPFARETGGGVPDQRIEPIDGARQLRDGLCSPVRALDVRELVHESRLPRLSRPRAADGGIITTDENKPAT